LTQSYFRHFSAGEDPHRLLDPAEQVSTPWGTPDHGPCDKCHGGAAVVYRCLSCVEEGARPDCPACDGRVEYLGRCPTCAGTGEIDHTERQGVSVFPTLGGLYRYLVGREFDFSDSVIVELRGDLCTEPDLDADEGALLVRPTDIVTQHPIDFERVAAVRERATEPA
jgi:DnaJ-class molecular chaperone